MVQGDQTISYQALVGKAEWFEKQLRADPDVETVDMVAGASGGGGGSGNQAQIWLQLKPIGVRKSSADQVIARLRQKTAGMPGAALYLQANQDLRIGGRSANAQYQYTLQAPDYASLRMWGPKVLDRLMKLPELADVSSDQQNAGLSSNVIIDRDTASRLGLTAQAVDSALYDAFGQRQVSVMYKSINQYHVVLALEQKWWESPEFLKKIYVQTPRGIDVPLAAFAKFNQGTTPLSLPHQGQFPATTISFNLKDGVSLSDAVLAIQRAGLEMGLPSTVTGKFAGTAQAFQDSLIEPADSDSDGAVRGVCGAWYAVREPDSSADDYFDTALGRAGRADRTGTDRNGSHDHGADRDYPADRDREEERDHDDRLCAGGGAE